MRIRKATLNDVSELWKMQSLFLAAPFKESDVAYEIKGNPTSQFYVMVEKDEIVGFIDFWITFDSATIAQLAVKKEYQRQGIAQKLLEKSIEILIKNEVIFYTLEVRESNVPAFNFYVKNGFEKVCIKPHYYDNGENAIYMLKGLV